MRMRLGKKFKIERSQRRKEVGTLPKRRNSGISTPKRIPISAPLHDFLDSPSDGRIGQGTLVLAGQTLYGARAIIFFSLRISETRL